MVFYRTSILVDEGGGKDDEQRHRELGGISEVGKTPHKLIFRSLGVDRKSKTPYSDATQVLTKFKLFFPFSISRTNFYDAVYLVVVRGTDGRKACGGRKSEQQS